MDVKYRAFFIGTTLALGSLCLNCGDSEGDSADAPSASLDAASLDGATLTDAAPASDAAPDPDQNWEPLVPLADRVWVRVKNRCSFDLWIHAAGSSGILQPDDHQLGSGQTMDYEAPKDWSAARVTAFKDGPRAGEIEKAEMTLQNAAVGAILNYNITYVDWVGLPMRMAGAGGDCGDSHVVGCFVPEQEILAKCPGDLAEADKCQSARSHCLNPSNQASQFCHALDDLISECAQNVPGCDAFAAATTPEAYACSGPLANEPRLCAALNRGMLSDPDSTDQAAYYQTKPYNTYAQWVHGVCPGIYAFSYDDWLAQGGFRACTGTELRITFCPAS